MFCFLPCLCGHTWTGGDRPRGQEGAGEKVEGGAAIEKDVVDSGDTVPRYPLAFNRSTGAPGPQSGSSTEATAKGSGLVLVTPAHQRRARRIVAGSHRAGWEQKPPLHIDVAELRQDRGSCCNKVCKLLNCKAEQRKTTLTSNRQNRKMCL